MEHENEDGVIVGDLAIKIFYEELWTLVESEYPMPKDEYYTRFTHMNPSVHGIKERTGDKVYFDENGKMIKERWDNYYKKCYKFLPNKAIDIVKDVHRNLLNRLFSEKQNAGGSVEVDKPALLQTENKEQIEASSLSFELSTKGVRAKISRFFGCKK